MNKLKYILTLLIAITMCVPAFPQVNPVTAQNLVQNYILNGGFENAKHGWAAYKNTSQSTPVNGTGGSPTTTITTSTSSPLAGKASGVISHPASNVQGEGVSYSFAIEPGARGRTISITGVYQISSGTYSGGTSSTDSDVEVYIYDVDAGIVIQPAGYKLDGGVTGTNYLINATFQSTYADTNYRLIFHEPNTTATAFALKIDSIIVGLQGKSVGAAMTDWTTYTPTWSSTGTAPAIGNGTIVGYYKRVGDHMDVQIYLTTGTTTTYGTLNWLFSIPTQFTPDTTKFPPTANNGLGVATATSSANNRYVGFVSYSSGNQFYAMNGGGTNAPYGSAVPFSFAASTANQIVSLQFSVPIVGWSSNTTVSDQSGDSRNFSLYANAITGSCTTTQSTINFGAATLDTAAGWNGSGQYTIQSPGVYEITANLIVTTPASYSGTGFIYLIKNGATTLVQGGTDISSTTGTGNWFNMPITWQGTLKAGDTIIVQASANNSYATTAYQSGFLSIKKLQSPTQVAASDTVAASYYNSTGVSYTTTGVSQTMTYDTKVKDSHGMMSAGVVTVPVSGTYMACATITMQSTGSANSADMFLSIGGLTFPYRVNTLSSAIQSMSTCGMANMAAGGTIFVQSRCYFPSGSCATINSLGPPQQLIVTRVGNY